MKADKKIIEPTDAIDRSEGFRSPQEKSEEEKIIIKRGKVDSITIYEVSESELQTIESGSPSSVYLNLFIFLFGIFISFLVTLLTIDLSSKLFLQTTFLLVDIVAGFSSGIVFIIWLRSKHDLNDVIIKIKNRIKT